MTSRSGLISRAYPTIPCADSILWRDVSGFDFDFQSPPERRFHQAVQIFAARFHFGSRRLRTVYLAGDALFHVQQIDAATGARCQRRGVTEGNAVERRMIQRDQYPRRYVGAAIKSAERSSCAKRGSHGRGTPVRLHGDPDEKRAKGAGNRTTAGPDQDGESAPRRAPSRQWPVAPSRDSRR